MDIILVHLGGNPPEHINTCVKQIRKHSNCYIHSITDDSVVNKNYGNFLKTNYFPNHDLWRYSCERFYAIEQYMKMVGLDEALHLEYDNLIYADPDDCKFERKHGNCIALPRITDRFLSGGIMYIGSFVALQQMNKALNDLMAKGQEYLLTRAGGEMINEMHLLGMVFEDGTAPLVELPVLPTMHTDYIFDGASWGQWVGGTHQTPGVPYAEEKHVVGRNILNGKYKVEWKDGKPFSSDRDGNRVPIFNLHIHSKELEKWSNVDKR